MPQEGPHRWAAERWAAEAADSAVEGVEEVEVEVLSEEAEEAGLSGAVVWSFRMLLWMEEGTSVSRSTFFKAALMLCSLTSGVAEAADVALVEWYPAFQGAVDSLALPSIEVARTLR